MQLSLWFEYEEQKKLPLKSEDFSHISEFEQGNFTNAIRSRFTAAEIAAILLKSDFTLPGLKKTLLIQRWKNANRLDIELNEKYKESIKLHNDSVRANLRVNYAKEDRNHMKKLGFDKFRKYNNAYWDLYGWKSSSKVSVTDENHEWHDKYLKEKETYMKESITLLCNSDIWDRGVIHSYYMQVFWEDEYREVRDDYFVSSILNAIKSENLESIRGLYTKAFGETYCVDSLNNMQITEKEKAYLMSLRQIPIATSLDAKDTEPIIENWSQRVFDDPTATLLYANMDKLEEVHTPHLTRLKKEYWRIIISMHLSDKEFSHIFKWFLKYVTTQINREWAVDLFTYCVDVFGREEINNLLFRKLQKSDAPLSDEEVSIVFKLAHDYLRRSS